MASFSEVFLQHGKKGEPMRTEQVEWKHTETPRFYSASGYGSRMPTAYMVRVNNRWRRVYCMCWSNVATFYIGGRNGEPYTIVKFY